MNQNTAKKLVIVVFLLYTQLALTQVPGQYQSGMPINFIRTWEASAPVTDANQLMIKDLKDAKQVTQYFDGLGRPLQTVFKRGSLETDPNNLQNSAEAKDLVTPVVYDAFGREQYKYLPFAANNTGGNSSINDGNFKLNPFQQQQTFMLAQYSPQGETCFFSKTNFEASPLNRVTETYAPGNSWAGSESLADPNQRRRIQVKYWINTSTDDVKIWNVSFSPSAGVFGTYTLYTAYNNGVYPAGELYKNVTVDEHGKQVIEFKDKEGKVILKKVQLTASADDGNGKNYEGWLCTYYIYDDLNNLRCVIQPEGVKKLAQYNWDFSQVPSAGGAILLAEQCFRYEYDSRNRMIMKKVPGAGEVYMVYDARDRLVMTQDANMRLLAKWMITKYDALNRPVETGFWNNNGLTFSEHLQNAYTAPNSNYPAYPETGIGYELLTVTHYDDYQNLPAGLNDFQATWNNHFSATNNNEWPYPQMPQKSDATRGMVTWTKTKVLGSANTFINLVTYYDVKGRPIQVQSSNLSGGTDVVTTQYSWSGLPLVTVTSSQNAGMGVQTTVIVTQNHFDDLGRLVKVEKKQSNNLVNGGAMSNYKTILENVYDGLGQLRTKKIGKKQDGSAPMETMTYEYNIRGWLLGVNRDYMNSAGQMGSTKFGFELGYDKAVNNAGNFYSAPQFNGNISGMIWKSDGDDVRRKYDFAYDAANRLMKGDFKQDNGGTTWDNSQMNYNMQMGNGMDPATAYDANGNIKAMTQYGWKMDGNTTTPIDNLTYNYYDYSNRLKNVIDANNDPGTKLGDFRTSLLHTQVKTEQTVDYTYDLNGNLKKDLNKDIGTTSQEDIVYNHLNLPQTITVRSAGGAVKGTISYTYDAAGNKLRKVTTELASAANGNTAIVTTTNYAGGFVYESKTVNGVAQYTDKLQFTGHEEGRIRALYDNPAQPHMLTGFAYDYMLKDHLGNVRMVLTEEQKQDKYPAATLENISFNGGTAISVEDDFYMINSDQIVQQAEVTGIPVYQNQNNNGIPPNSNPYSNTTANSQRLYKINGNDANKTGLGITLKVMAGDRIDVLGKSYYFQANTGGTGGTNSQFLLEILTGLLGNPSGNASGITHGGVTVGQLSGLPATTTGINNLVISQSATQNADPPPPLAFINYIFFDEQFRYVQGGFSQAGAQNQLKDHFAELQNLTAQKNGYVYIYVSNRSTINVFFDNLQVVHTRGPILEETHYYPFGLTMAGISSKALAFGGAENKIKFQGQEFATKEFSDGSGLEMYEFKYRMHDPQIGRFWQSDPLAHDYRYNSPYAFSENRVTSGVELEGLEYVSIHHLSNGGRIVQNHYKSTDAEINKMNGTTSGLYNSASYGPQGKGVVHYYYNSKGEIYDTRWDQQQTGGNSDLAYHGLYSGPGSITKDGGENSTNYDFSFQPIDWADAIAKRHDMDYAEATATGEAYAGFLEDVRTVQADRDMVKRIGDYKDLFKKVEGVETPYRTSWSGEMELAMKGQEVVISALATYKQWKIDNGYGNKDTYDKLRDQFRKDNGLVAAIIDLINPNKK